MFGRKQTTVRPAMNGRDGAAPSTGTRGVLVIARDYGAINSVQSVIQKEGWHSTFATPATLLGGDYPGTGDVLVLRELDTETKKAVCQLLRKRQSKHQLLRIA